MCLLVCGIGEDGSVLLAANRDERYDRPTSAPYVWDERPAILAGRDELAGGTWLATNDQGVVAAVTNRPTVGAEQPDRPSRGELPLLACRSGRADEAGRALEDRLALTRYNGFNLFVADAANAFVIQAAGVDFSIAPAGPGWHVGGNGAWDDHTEARVARAWEILHKGGAPGQVPSDESVETVMRICRDHCPLAGGGNLCLHGPEAGTVSSTILWLDPDRQLRRYLYAGGPPCRNAYIDLTPSGWGDVVGPSRR